MLSMSDPGSLPGGVGMLGPFDSIYEPPKPRFMFKMPRVVPEQKHKFETDELFRRLSRESEVRYTGYRDRPPEERQIRFQNGCREGHTEIAFVATGTNVQLVFNTSTSSNSVPLAYISNRSLGSAGSVSGQDIDFEKEHGKVHLRANFIMNGVCVCWRGWIDLERLDGVGCLEFNEAQAKKEDELLREQIDMYNHKLREFEGRHRGYRGGTIPSHSERGGTGNGNGNSGSGSGGIHGQTLEMFSNG